jgi:YegS/Rv2252/BmrU family lipid kinase
MAAKSAADGVDIVVAVGGDGTVNMAAQGLIGTQTALAVLPTGSGNGFARNMGIPLRLDRALDLIREKVIRSIDVGRVDGRIFLVACGIGWEAVIATVFEGSKMRGVLPYATAALSTFLQYEPQEIEISSQPGNWNYRGRPMMFSIMNMSEIGTGVTISPEADTLDGLLDICMIPRQDLLGVMKHTPDLFRHRTDALPGYIRRLASEIVIHRSIPGNIHIDGSPVPCGETVNVQVLPGALRVIGRKEKRNELRNNRTLRLA